MKPATHIAGVILRDESGRYLLVQEAQEKVRGLWNLPAGYADTAETPLQAAVREAHEEVGLVVKIDNMKPIYETFNPDKNRTYSAYSAQIVGGELHHQPEELLSAEWKTFDEIKLLNEANQIREPWIMEALTRANT